MHLFRRKNTPGYIYNIWRFIKYNFFSIYYIAPFSITNNYCRWNMLPVGWYKLKKSGCKLSRQWLMLLFRKLLLIQVKKCFLNWHWHNRPFPCSIENTSKKLHWTRLNDAIFFTLNVVCTLDLLNNVFFIRMSAHFQLNWYTVRGLVYCRSDHFFRG